MESVRLAPGFLINKEKIWTAIIQWKANANEVREQSERRKHASSLLEKG